MKSKMRMFNYRTYLSALILISLFVLSVRQIYAQTEVSGVINSDMQWSVELSPYRVVADLELSSSAVLHIDPGVRVELLPDVNIRIKGELYAVGSTDEPILFTSDIYNPDKPYWGGIIFESSTIANESHMDNCIVEYSGSKSHAGIRLVNQKIPRIGMVEMQNNYLNALAVEFEVVDINMIFDSKKVPYYIPHQIQIESSASINIEKSVVLKFASEASIICDGTIVANGSNENKIVFSSVYDNDVGGQSFSYETTQAHPGDWGGIKISEKSAKRKNTFSFCEIKFAGSNSEFMNAVIVSENSNFKLEYSLISNFPIYGIVCLGDADPDLGGGQMNSAGMNIFSGTAGFKYAVFNRGKSDINARGNCWNKADSIGIDEIIYDKHNSNPRGEVLFMPFNADCTPVPPDKVQLQRPEDNEKNVKLIADLNWNTVDAATQYELNLSEDISFPVGSSKVQKILYSDVRAFGLKTNTRYYWKVRAENGAGQGEFSDVRSFTTRDTSRPAAPDLFFPPDSLSELPSFVLLKWEDLSAADIYLLEIAADSAFESIILDINDVEISEYLFTKTDFGREYFWRVRAQNENGIGAYSEIFRFKVKVTPDPSTAPPDSWKHGLRTGSNSTLIIPAGIDTLSEDRLIEPGDAIGVFHNNNNELRCCGYSVWSGRGNTALTVWGDNPQTAEAKEGFAENEFMRFKIWKSRSETELPVYVVLSDVETYYSSESVDKIGKIKNLDTIEWYFDPNVVMKHKSVIVPFQVNINYFDFHSEIKIASDSNLYDPKNNITELKTLKYNSDYYIRSLEPEFMSIAGFIPDKKLCYLNNCSRKTELFLNQFKDSISTTDFNKMLHSGIVALYDDRGLLYAPDENIDQLNYLMPGRSYGICLKQNDTIDFNIPIQSVISKPSSPQESECYLPEHEFTGRKSILIIDTEGLDQGDEIAVIDTSEKVVGSAVIKGNKQIVFSVWGDNPLTAAINEGAREAAELQCKIYDKSEDKEYRGELLSAVNFLTEQDQPQISFRTDNIYKLKLKKSTTSEVVGMKKTRNINLRAVVYPEFEYADILFESENLSYVSASLINTSGHESYLIRNQFMQVGSCKITFATGEYSSGLYICVLKIGDSCHYTKVLLLK